MDLRGVSFNIITISSSRAFPRLLVRLSDSLMFSIPIFLHTLGITITFVNALRQPFDQK
jgi:hypothetical protein